MKFLNFVRIVSPMIFGNLVDTNLLRQYRYCSLSTSDFEVNCTLILNLDS